MERRAQKTQKNWLTKASNVINEADDVDKEANVGRRCLSGLLPNCCSLNCCSRLKLRKQTLEFTNEMVTLLNEASHFSEESSTFWGMEMPNTGLIGSTADESLKKVWECIEGHEYKKIGVYGMPGVGKKTIMKTINNRLVKRFENVLWVTVSKAVDAQTLQKQIAKVLDLDLSDDQDEARRSSLLLKELRRIGKFVLILDDMWKAFDLQALGVPEPTEDNGCKIILTTISNEVCKGMLCQKDVKVEPLSKDEAWELFLIHVAEQLGPEVEEIAKEVVAECCGLPLVIIAIGQAMRSKDVGEWRVALSDLKESISLNLAVEEKVMQCLKYIYDQLKENDKKCFLYFAMYPKDFLIKTSELIEYWVMEGLVKGSSKEDEMLRGRGILNTLKHCCMLEVSLKGEVSLEGRRYEYEYSDYVKMHNLIRDMALYVTKSKPKFMVKTGLSSTKILHEDDWSEDLERVSFMQSCIEDIDPRLIIPNCPKLSTLILKCPRLKHVAHGFFRPMKSLTVLDLSWTLIESLPDSVSDLVNLRGLLLINCENLVRVPSLSKLQPLRVLNLTMSAIEELPQGMEMLVNLRSLDLSYNRKLKEMIPTGLISKFSLLQELKLQEINVYARERGGDFVQELTRLTQLENLRISFHELSDFIAYGKFGNFERLKKYFIGMERDTYPRSQHERSLFLSNSKGILCNALSLPKRIQFLQVEEFNQITRLSELTLNDSQQDLRELWIYSCNSIEFIYEKVPAHGAFPCLKSLVIDSCDNIKILSSSRLFQQLVNLEEIIVMFCAEMEELIVEEEEEEEEEPVEGTGTGIDCTIALPRLKTLYFRNLPKLKSIWKGVMVCDSLQTVTVRNCPELKRLRLFNREHQSAPPSLKVIKGSREWWDSLEWGGYQCPEHLFKEIE